MKLQHVHRNSIGHLKPVHDARVVRASQAHGQVDVAAHLDELGHRAARIHFSGAGESARRFAISLYRRAAENFAGMHHADDFYRDGVFYVRRNLEMEQCRFLHFADRRRFFCVSQISFAFKPEIISEFESIEYIN